MASRTQQRIQYEDLVPKSEWKDEPEATLLTIHLPGFAKEQIKVTYVHSSKMIRVTGERPVGDRRWSRFNEVFIVPQNCLVDKIHGSLKNNVLTITMPKETITKTAYLPEASKLEEKKLLEEARRKQMVEEAEQEKKKLLEEREGLIRNLEEVKRKKKEEAEEKKLLEEARRKQMVEEAEQEKKKLLEEREGLIRNLEEVKRKKKEEAEEKKKMQFLEEIRKMEEEAKAKEMAEEMRKLDEEVKAKVKAEEMRKLDEEATLKKIQEIKPVEEAKQMLKPEDRKLPEVNYTKSGPKSGVKSGSERVREVVKSVEEKLGYVMEKEKRMEKGIMEKIRGKEITSEEKKLMVNVGVAALVIFALGAYVSYTFCSPSSSSSSSSSTKPE